MTDGFVDYWENVVNNQPDSPEYSFARKMVETPKVVFSRTLGGVKMAQDISLSILKQISC
jgi:hypothetical protein